ncbi:hypothetical protein SDC9_158924 [bioreactor metagenome]|uniref:Uncharacterized protein n=1 Tax=bioreactor metagenome TaxID=1076179 RepID=A0A645FCH8_9ZZZZ
MPVTHQHFRRPGGAETVDHGIDFLRQEPLALIVIAPFGKDPVLEVEDSGDALHVGHQKDFHNRPQSLKVRKGSCGLSGALSKHCFRCSMSARNSRMASFGSLVVGSSKEIQPSKRASFSA